MNTIQRLLTISALAMGVALPMAGHAQVSPNSGQTAATAPASMTDGEVKKVDSDNGKITLKHGDIKNLDMPGMTMVFTVRDKGQLTNLKPGDKVQFMVIQEGGKMIVTDIQPAR
ncbi:MULTISPECIES: copper-binding protein [Melaminivora]|uniref:Copper-binding protein n=1 Tax=Melaminivora suipulveris TaxID=2109913 RepID=A0A2R3QAI4_9BURK|nr:MULTISPECIES: copper-binding protein [Melaminivora]AVO48786.1 copper-binding protein [Melaminivora suipulveris]